MTKINFTFIILIFFYISLEAQISGEPTGIELTKSIHVPSQFSEVNFNNQTTLLSTTNIESVLIVCVADMNGDKLDDIVRLNNGTDLMIEYQSCGSGFSNYTYGLVSGAPQLNIAVADVDDNGFNDILVSDQFDTITLLLANDDGTSYTETILPVPTSSTTFLVQGSNFVDINEDGLVDIFICNDLNESVIWENMGSGNFEINEDWIDLDIFPNLDDAGNYASSWTDLDNDGDLDLHISKCFKDVPSTSPKRINQFFLNDGNNNFSEMAEAHGLKNGAQSWTADFQDIDNDNDLDCFVVNHTNDTSELVQSQLFLNDGTGHFEDITASTGLDIELNHLQGILRDFDNDGFVDVLVAGLDGYEFYQNNGDLTFTENEDIFDTYHMGTFAIGDLNHDGFLDVYSANSNTSSNDTMKNDVLWINEKNENNFLAINLEATSSHSNAIGSRLEIYGDWGIQIREVRAGESYGIMNSYTQYFGLGTAETIDSLLIRWPSGNVEVFHEPQINQFLNVVENECAYPDINISCGGSMTICSGDTLLLSAPLGSSYIWSNGADDQEISIVEGGIYQVTVTNDYACSSISLPIEIIQDPDTIPVITPSGATTFCAGSNVFLHSSQIGDNLWSTGQTSSSILVFQSGEYSLTTSGVCGDLTSEPIDVNVIPLPPDPEVENDFIYLDNVPASGTLTATGDNIYWFAEPNGGNSIGEGNTFITPELIETTAYYAQDITTVDDVTCSSDRVIGIVEIDSVNATIEPIDEALFTIYPNPAENYIVFIKGQKELDDVQVSLMNAAGQKVMGTTISATRTETQIGIEELINGMYTMIIETSEGRLFYKKVLVIRN